MTGHYAEHGPAPRPPRCPSCTTTMLIEKTSRAVCPRCDFEVALLWSARHDRVRADLTPATLDAARRWANYRAAHPGWRDDDLEGYEG